MRPRGRDAGDRINSCSCSQRSSYWLWDRSARLTSLLRYPCENFALALISSFSTQSVRKPTFPWPLFPPVSTRTHSIGAGPCATSAFLINAEPNMSDVECTSAGLQMVIPGCERRTLPTRRVEDIGQDLLSLHKPPSLREQLETRADAPLRPGKGQKPLPKTGLFGPWVASRSERYNDAAPRVGSTQASTCGPAKQRSRARSARFARQEKYIERHSHVKQATAGLRGLLQDGGRGGPSP
jgi:hypothetical protein